ncbi:MAG: TlpA disulfide reductase family protein [Chloroflexi bacterium]|nr:TlpA disulfide reductase family protein [Chloroflexota bacterium]
MPQFQAFYEGFGDEFLLLGIDIGPFMRLGSNADAEALLQELGVTYPTGWTDDGSVPRKYGVTSMPTTVFINSNGVIFEKAVGAIDANRLIRTTQAMMAAEANLGS